MPLIGGSIVHMICLEPVAVATTPAEVMLTESVRTYRLPRGTAIGGSGRANQSGTDIAAPMPGLLVEFLHPSGARLQQGDPVLIFEAMKTDAVPDRALRWRSVRNAACGRIDRFGRCTARPPDSE